MDILLLHPRGIQRGSIGSLSRTSQMDPRLTMSGMTEGEKACGVKREKEKVGREKLGVKGKRIFLPLRLTPYGTFPSLPAIS